MTGSAVRGQQTPPATTQAQPDALADSIRELQVQVRELRAAISQIQSESARYRAETLELRRELQAAKVQQGSSSSQTQQTVPSQHAASSLSPLLPGDGRTLGQAPAESIEARVSRLEEESQLQAGKIDEQYQTKVESASKYRVRLSGMALLNLFSNRGTVDN